MTKKGKTKYIFVTYESPYTPCAGIAAVIGRLSKMFLDHLSKDVAVIQPYHHLQDKHKKKDQCKLRQFEKEPGALKVISSTVMAFTGKKIPVEIVSHEDQEMPPFYFLRPRDKSFFAGKRHPYDVAVNQDEIGEILRRDALFFGSATIQAIPIIAKEYEIVLLMQDWEAATTSLAMVGKELPWKQFLTLHNSYDSGAVSKQILKDMGIDSDLCPGPSDTGMPTVLERVFPLIEKTIFSVSRQFAIDLTEDTLQASVMADHFPDDLRQRLVGVDNGPFTECELDDKMLKAAEAGLFNALKKWKEEKKKQAIKALKQHKSTDEEPLWGDIKKFRTDEAPWFVLAGRDDTRQKGYDVAACAIEGFIKNKGDARFLFFPIPGDEDRQGLTFLQRLAECYPEYVLVLPFRFQAGYFKGLMGSTFGIMPSLYEPFGMANEFYLKGTPGIARATGGIIQQIAPLRSVETFTPAVQTRSDKWHEESGLETGILYREPDDLPTMVEDWRGINAADYDATGKDTARDRVNQRMRYPLFEAMAVQLQSAIVCGIDVYHNNEKLYYKMIADGVRHIQKSFSWERAAREYYEGISRK